MASRVSPRPPISPSALSIRLMVMTDTAERLAKSFWFHPSNARAAFICRIVTFCIDNSSTPMRYFLYLMNLCLKPLQRAALRGVNAQIDPIVTCNKIYQGRQKQVVLTYRIAAGAEMGNQDRTRGRPRSGTKSYQ
jgi:hypothetical protein